MRAGRRVGDLLFTTLLIVFGLLIIFPFVWMVLTSLKAPDDILVWPPRLLPRQLTMLNYQGVFEHTRIIRYFLNTLRFGLVSTLCIVFTSALAGYVFAKYEFPLKEPLFLLVIATMMIPFQCYMVPLYLLMVRWHLVDSYLGLQLPYLVQAIGTFFMRQNFESFPDEYLDAGRIEGASEAALFFRVALPHGQSAMGGLSIFIFSMIWGNLIWPLIITSSEKNFVLELGLNAFQGRYSVEYGQFTAAAALAILPVLIFFFIFRNRIIEGITLSGIK
jgi:multiple sugar transport system permease protein